MTQYILDFSMEIEDFQIENMLCCHSREPILLKPPRILVGLSLLKTNKYVKS